MKQGPASIRAIKRRFKHMSNYGRRCKMYGAGCPICEGYRFLLERGRFPYTFEEAHKYGDTHDMDAPSISWTELAKNPGYAVKPIT